jgi:hypothetical protein
VRYVFYRRRPQRCNNHGVARVFATVCAATALLAAGAAAAPAPIVPHFDRPAATAGDRLTVRATGFASRKPLRVYLVRGAEAKEVRGPLDLRLHFVGVLNPKRGRASTTFTLPPLPSGRYAAWCVGCRPTAALRVTMPTATAESCPTTMPSTRLPRGLSGSWLGNGLLWTWQPPGGVWNVDPRLVQPDGVLFNKQLWLARPMFGNLTVRLERLDAPAPLIDVVTVAGTFSLWEGPSWASRMRYPAGGCWLVRGRIADVALSYVVKVVAPAS